MTKPILTVLAISAATLGLAACSSWDSPANKAPGTYKTTTESTSPNGTTTTTNKTTDVYTDAYGNKKATVKTDTTTDPKGLFNKQTNTSVQTYN